MWPWQSRWRHKPEYIKFMIMMILHLRNSDKIYLGSLGLFVATISLCVCVILSVSFCMWMLLDISELSFCYEIVHIFLLFCVCQYLYSVCMCSYIWFVEVLCELVVSIIVQMISIAISCFFYIIHVNILKYFCTINLLWYHLHYHSSVVSIFCFPHIFSIDIANIFLLFIVTTSAFPSDICVDIIKLFSHYIY